MTAKPILMLYEEPRVVAGLYVAGTLLREPTDLEVVDALIARGGELLDWCLSHDSKWERMPSIHDGCGWANGMKPCIKSPTRRLVFNVLDIQEEI